MSKDFHNKNIMFTFIAFFISVAIDYTNIMYLKPRFRGVQGGLVPILNWNLITTLPVLLLVYFFLYIINKKFPSFNLKTKKSKVTYGFVLLLCILFPPFYMKPKIIEKVRGIINTEIEEWNSRPVVPMR